MANEILAEAKSLNDILNHKKYEIDYYQREYVWQETQVQELIEDLTNKFEEHYEETHSRKEVSKSYNPYFMGSIIVCEPSGESSSYIIDGQQRLTSLTLLLIFLYHNLNPEDKDQISPLIKSRKSGEFSFNLDVPERKEVMESLLKNQEVSETLIGKEESLNNLVERYKNIENHFPDNIKEDKDKALPYFTDWLLDRVMVSKITAKSDEDAYVIFETMNDRGISLTPVEMLRSYLLANIKKKESRDKAKSIWHEEIKNLQDIDKKLEANSIKAWLRGQHAEEVRDIKVGSTNKDFELIATQFHRWVRDNNKSIGLERPEDFSRFIEKDFCFYSGWYRRLYTWAHQYDPEFLAIRSNGHLRFNLQFSAILSALRPQDKEEEIKRKIKVVSTYIDILLARYVWNFKLITEAALKYHMFLAVIRKIRGKPVDKIAQILKKNLDGKEAVPAFDQTRRFYWHRINRPRIHLILARITDYIETQSNHSETRFSEYINEASPKKNRFETVHIVDDKPNKYDSELYANRDIIGGLLLLPQSTSWNMGKNLSYKKKKEVYLNENLLASSLHQETYKNNSGFKRFIKESNLPFEPYDEFDRESLDKRHNLYLKIAEQIWDPERLTKIAEGKE